jgi:hypothetical protein
MNRRLTSLITVVALVVSGTVWANGPGARQDIGVLDDAETKALVYMREEEKLARDVYLGLHELWGSLIFANIADAEQRHMDAMARMLDLYGIGDPVVSDAVGAFSAASGLNTWYAELMDRGNDSLLEAFMTGAYIEEMDIGDLQSAIAATDEQSLISAYTNLLAGSRNHLRAFVAHITALGVDYEAQRLDQADVDAIVGDYSDVVPNEGFTINANLSDAWYYPGTEGQGFFLSVFPDQQKILLAWFTYDTELPEETATATLGDPGQRWLTAQGKYAGAQAELQLYSSHGGLFDQGSPVPVHEQIGSLLLQFEDCANGTVFYDIPALGEADRTGLIPIQRVAPDNVTHCERADQP